MELNPFKVKNKKRQVFVLSSLLVVFFLIVVVIIQSYALYEVQKEYNVIEGSVPSHMDNFDVKVALTIDGTPSTTFPEKGSGKTVDSITCDKGATASWDYEKWKISVTNLSKTKTKCQVNFVTKYTDSVLNGNDPVLAENLIPVTIENQNGENIVKKASQKDAWYDYTGKKWANAVILKDENETYKAGEQIPEDKIESYFVWIPKFEYKIFSTTNYNDLDGINENYNANEHAIEVRFKNESTADTTSECKSPNKSGDLGTCTIGKWMTHPAFVDGFEGKRGMWVGKFEPSNAAGHENMIDPDNLQIKPNAVSWRNIQPAQAFYSTYDYKRELDSHMMKNTEWGAVAYLTHSIYGRCNSLTNCSEVRINNNTNYITGYAALHEPTTGSVVASTSCTTNPVACNEYGTNSSITRPWNDESTLGLSSTTGNVSGVYDMSGGANEDLMGVMLTNNGELISGHSNQYHSNFIGILTYPSDSLDKKTNEILLADGAHSYPEKKYVDVYSYNTSYAAYGRMILGDATGELGPFEDRLYNGSKWRISTWYLDNAGFVCASHPWFFRGGISSNGKVGGVFSFSNNYGNPLNHATFRVVLSP